MPRDPDQLAAELLHHRSAGLAPGDSLTPPLVAASVFHLPGEPTAPFQYGRFSNPTWEVLERALGILEEAQTVLFPSGMAATAGVCYGHLRSGDRVLLPSDGYYTTRALIERFLAPLGVAMDLRPTVGFAQGGFDGYRLVWVETPSNPGLEVCDLAEVAQAAHRAGALVVADNTTMTPLGQRPLDLGADLVVAADTKAPNGHSDVLLGHVAARDAGLLERVREWRKLAGAIPGPFEAWLGHRGLATLEVRFERMCASALAVAERLAAHPKIAAVRHPGLAGDPSHAIARRQMARFGFLVGVTFADGRTAERFIAACRFVEAATSFGGVHTTAERRARWGDQVPDGYVRLSIGCEPLEPLWAEMARVLEAP